MNNKQDMGTAKQDKAVTGTDYKGNIIRGIVSGAVRWVFDKVFNSLTD